ncbi:hypothetical protein V6N13_027355 [Hibiscus sabdariffa]
MCKCRSHGTFPLFGLQSSHLNICYYHQDLHRRPLRPGSRPGFYGDRRALLLIEAWPLPRRPGIGHALKRHPFSGLVDSAAPRGATGSGHDGALTLSGAPFQGTWARSVAEDASPDYNSDAEGDRFSSWAIPGSLAVTKGILAGFDNDPSAGSPTETLLRLLLPLNDKVQWTSRDVAGSEPPTSPRSEHFTGPFNRAGGTTRPIKARSASPAVGTSRPVLTVRRTDRPTPRSNYELFNCNNLNIRYWSWNYRGCWHQTCPPMDPR